MNTRIIIIMVGLMLMLGRGYAQISAEGQKMQGRWEIVKVEATLFSQGDEKVLERKVLTVKDSIMTASREIPLLLQFEGNICKIGAISEIDSCRWEPPFLLLYEATTRQTPPLYKFWWYDVSVEGQLTFKLPAIYYMDAGHKLPVKQVFICTYDNKRK
ncbi:hypothetical protein HHL17_14425 [Chitinophaga sp. G-6-1-13]|uniref:Lipocalin-like domain-containing protein n=1 Tax=Chitinophaga fulva TaxID=2728842 RepID=A0A848GP21_9BACT|nr:hypothetical protein [Chitinophaga fulva]NML38400.1 hypothetical protein [Chitinophaga fulva]